MRNIFLITKREFLTQVKKKSFIILTLLAPLLMAAFGGFISYIFKANQTQYNFNVIDKSGLFIGKLVSNDEIKYVYVNPSTEPQLKNALKEMQGIDGLLVIPENTAKDYDLLEKNTKLFTNKKVGFDTRQKIADDMVKVLREAKIKDLGLEEGRIKNLDKPFELNTEKYRRKK